ncbi:hypothetical protein OGAPHI_002429 [Ogataea philodendri]|uniref:Uncharacterized protein n=1 Tax=Ogataea philodendri TaxID=1378263 RepID=A0A9P8T7Z9_9ASCO|nr:uncharacterized protein OGAPHI_002429 [Ogataea philodendri]KAH3668675.1 hypothetical protein OGAPHI_002429 [Ogataea philodendri]
MATVIGPTPPGTGVILEALSLHESKSTSPHILWPDFFVSSFTVGDAFLVQMRRKRQLDQDSVNFGVRVQGRDQIEQIGLGHGVWELLQRPVDAHFLTRLELHLDVGGRVWALSNLDNDKFGEKSRVLLLQGDDLCGDRVAQLFTDGFPVNNGHIFGWTDFST